MKSLILASLLAVIAASVAQPAAAIPTEPCGMIQLCKTSPTGPPV